MRNLLKRRQQALSLSSLLFDGFLYLIASRRDAPTLCPCPPGWSGSGRGTSMELCGLLRKTGAKIPAGPFRYGDATQ